MINVDEDALICDYVEYYRVFDYRQLPARTAAILACGLRDESRIKMKMQGYRYTLEQIQQAMVIDRLSMLVWFGSKDGKHGWNRPASLAEKMLEKSVLHTTKGFDTANDFMEWRNKFVEG